MKQIRVGIVGCGSIGNIHAQCLTKIEGAKLVAFADVNLANAEKAVQAYGGEYADTQAERLFADKSIHAIVIATRHDSHAPLAIAAAKSGKHILIEKPLALSLADCEGIALAVQEAGVCLMPAFKLRYYPLIRRAKEFLPQPQVLMGQVMDNRWGDGFWAQDPIQGGANVHSQGCHITDLLRFLAGSEPVRLWAAGGAMTHPNHPCIDQCVASIQFAHGGVASLVVGDAAVGGFTSKFFVQAFGEGKSVQLHDRFKKATFFDGKETWTEEREDEEGFFLENVEFIRALQEGRTPELTALDGLQATRMVLAADAAIRTGAVQTL